MSDEVQLPPVSDDFMDVVCKGASLIVRCDFCDRTHFATGSNPGDYMEGELESLREKAIKEPDEYIEDSRNDMIGFGFIEGRQIAFGCPCNSGSRYEQFIWAHREMILEYIGRRVEQEQRAASSSAAALARARGGAA